MEDYHLISQIGEGSFGRVYKARRKYTGRLVAVKMISKLGQSKDDLTSFRREIDLLQRVSHPNIMRMFCMFETDTDFCVVSELGRGDLFQIINDEQTLPESVLRNVAAQLVSSLGHLHSLNIIHRDMKPQNILIAERGAIKICDFGFARALSNTTLVLTSIKGTPLYMAPELVQEQPYNEKVDIWALGTILYELYYGQPPFYTNSIYKLIQMIVNSPISFPGKISEDFKSFLLEMLQKDPSKRATCNELLKHPFIAGVELAKFDDRVYRFKSTQFEKAIQESLADKSTCFKPKKSKIPDYQMIFVNPSSFSDEEKLLALQYIREQNIPADSPLAASFAFHLKSFLDNPYLAEEALRAATVLLMKDAERFGTPFACAIELIGSDNFPKAAVDFFTELLSVPFSQNIVACNDFQVGDLQLTSKKCSKFRDTLLSISFSSDIETSENIYSLLSFFAQENELFITELSNTFAPQFIPIMVNTFNSQKSVLLQCEALCILTKVFEKNGACIQYLQPIDKFYETMNQIIRGSIPNLQHFCLFSAVLSFFAINIDLLASNPIFQKEFSIRESLSNLATFVISVFEGKSGLVATTKTLLEMASLQPQSTSELLCYGSLLSSPFIHIPMSAEILPFCVSKINDLLSFHQPSLLTAILNLDQREILQYVPRFIPLYKLPICATTISDFVLETIELPGPRTDVIAEQLIENGILLQIASMICEFGPEVPPNVVLLQTQLILTIKTPTKVLVEQSTEILNSVFSVDSAAESGLLIASHFARLSADFLPALKECGALNLAIRCLQSEIFALRGKALDLIGNICRHIALPEDYLNDFIQLVLDNLCIDDTNCQKLASFALGNMIFRDPSISEYVMEISEVLKQLLNSPEPKVVDNVAGVIGNIVRSSDKYLNDIIDQGILRDLINTLNNEMLGGRTILPLALFCQYETARQYLKTNNATPLIEKYTSSMIDRIKRYSKSILDSIQ